MYFKSNIQKYIAFSEDSIIDVLKKINVNESRIIFVVSEHAKLLGSLSDGDVRRWLTETNKLDLFLPVSEIMNSRVRSLPLGADNEQLNAVFSEGNGIDCIPLIDNSYHLVQIAFKKSNGIVVGDREISEKAPSFIIAEIGNNHQGDIDLAKKLVDHAVQAGADCAKFQMRNMKKLYRNEGDAKDASADLGAQYTLDLLSRFQLTNEQLMEVFDYCKSQKIIPLCTPWDLESLHVLEEYGVEAYKVASADFTNYELLAAIAKTGKPFFCSTGMSTEAEIKSTVTYLDGLGSNYVLLHCNSTYPSPFKDVNLRYLTRLKEITGKLVGYSGHERGIEVPIASIALGACIIEKHLTTDKNLEGTDHKVSLLPEEFARMVRKIRNVEEGLGSDKSPRELTQGEMINRENLAKSLVAKANLTTGTRITRDVIEIKSPGQGLQPNRIEELVGKVLERDVQQGGFFYPSDITGGVKKRNDYHFNRPFGVPVRYHDYHQIVNGSNLSFVEFHLSYKDLEVQLSDFFDKQEAIGFAVHSPELFSGDHILDLCSANQEYRQRSINELQRVVNITHELKTFFPATEIPVIVVNAGGWDKHGFIDPTQKMEKYQQVADALNSMDLQGVQIAIQTMPPFPWHFGGQSYHNLFVDADEMVQFCQNNPAIKICLDVSHTMMACSYYGWDLYECTQKIAPYNVHMHIVDAKGIDGEGIEIGKGDVDFTRFSRLIDDACPDIQFIPEVWQGHKNGGEGFWNALNFLEKLMTQ